MSFLEPRVSFSSNFASLFSVMRHNSSVLFHVIFVCFGQMDPIKVHIFRLSTTRMKINQISYVKSQFSFKLCNTFCNTNCQTFRCSNESSPNSSCHFWNHKVRLCSNFASLFSVMKDVFLCIFLVQTSSYILGKNSPLKWNFWTFEWLDENSPNSSCHIWNHKSAF